MSAADLPRTPAGWPAIEKPIAAWVTVHARDGAYYQVVMVRSPDQVQGDNIRLDELGAVIVSREGFRPAADSRGAIRFDAEDFSTELWAGDPTRLAIEAVRRVVALAGGGATNFKPSELAVAACRAHLRAPTDQSRRLALATLLIDAAAELTNDTLRTRLWVGLGDLDQAADLAEQLWDEQVTGTTDEAVFEMLFASICWVEHGSPVLDPHWLVGVIGRVGGSARKDVER